MSEITRKYFKPAQMTTGMRAEIDIPVGVWFHRYGTPEYWSALKKEMESEAKELESFIRDHRSRDHYQISVIRETVDICPFCGHDWELNNGEPVCCETMMDYFEGKITDEEAEKLIKYGD